MKRWGYLDKRGEVVIRPQFEWAFAFREGRAPVNIGDRHGYIDEQGTVVIPPIYGPNSTSFSEGSAAVEFENNRMGLIDANGKLLNTQQFAYLEPLSCGLSLATADDKTCFIYPDGSVLRGDLFSAESFSDGYAAVELDDGWYYMNIKGELEFGPFVVAGDFHSDIAVVKTGGGYHVLSVDGTLHATASQYVSTHVSNQRISFNQNGKAGFLDASGQVVIEPTFDESNSFYRSIAAARIGNKWGAIDRHGAWIVEPVFDSMGSFCDDVSVVTRSGQQQVIDTSGSILFEPTKTVIGSFSAGMVVFQE